MVNLTFTKKYGFGFRAIPGSDAALLLEVALFDLAKAAACYPCVVGCHVHMLCRLGNFCSLGSHCWLFLGGHAVGRPFVAAILPIFGFQLLRGHYTR